MVIRSCIPLRFRLLHLYLDVKPQKNKSKFVKNELYFTVYPPRKKLVIFAKMTKIMCNIKIRTVSLFYKKHVKFPKNVFWQMRTICTCGVHVMYSAPFLCITPVAWWFTIKKQSKMSDILSKFLPGGPPGKFVLFPKIVH